MDLAYELNPFIHFDHYFNIIDKIKSLSTCHRRSIGCLLVDKEGHVLSSGFNGSPLQIGNCKDDETICPDRNLPAGAGTNKYVKCYGVHAEIRALKDCKNISDVYAMFSTKAPCLQCTLTLLTTPCELIVFEEPSNETLPKEIWVNSGFQWIQWIHST